MPDDCIFCRIIRHEAPASIVHEAEHVVVFMSLHQFNAGHALVVPREHIVNIYSLPDRLAGPLFAASARVARAIKKAFQADGVTIRQHNERAGGQEVMHLHVHVVPRYYEDSGRPFPGLPADRETLNRLAQQLQAALVQN